MNAASISASTFVLRNSASALVAATVSYNSTTRIATLTPSQPLGASTTYTATIVGASTGLKDAVGNPMVGNYAVSFTTGAATTPQAAISIWPASAAPRSFATSGTSSVELGVKFRSDVAGLVTGVRFYKGTATTGTHTGTLWSRTGTKLATVTFTNETASGWQQAMFSTPVAIAANTVYVVSYHSNVGRYAYTHHTFATAGVDAAPLHALKAGVSGGNVSTVMAAASCFPVPASTRATTGSTSYSCRDSSNVLRPAGTPRPPLRPSICWLRPSGADPRCSDEKGAICLTSLLNSARDSATIRRIGTVQGGESMPSHSPRAERLTFPIPIMYRRRGDEHWFASRVLNLSDSGVLFGPTELTLGTPVEIILTTPTQIAWFSPGKQVCPAEVVRATADGAVAARFVGGRRCFES
jgi:Domain of unknown function (DUF4082)/Bacterial Ig-like domain